MKLPFSGPEPGLTDSYSAGAFATAGRSPDGTWRQLSPRVRLYDAGCDPTGIGAPDQVQLAQRSSPGGAFVFGDGSHPTTRLCAGAVDLLCRQRPGLSVLDVGTGSGVLARIARARGASFVAGTDIDPAALESARGNAELDDSPQPIHFGPEPPDHWGPRFDLVVANILSEPLVELAPRLVGATASGGQLLLSGFTRLQVPALRQAFEARGARFEREASQGEWALILLDYPTR